MSSKVALREGGGVEEEVCENSRQYSECYTEPQATPGPVKQPPHPNGQGTHGHHQLNIAGKFYFLESPVKEPTLQPHYFQSQHTYIRTYITKHTVLADLAPAGNFKSIVLKSRRESAHARTFGGDFELKILRMRRFSSRFWTMDLKFPVPL